MTLSTQTKPEVHNVLHRRQRRTELNGMIISLIYLLLMTWKINATRNHKHRLAAAKPAACTEKEFLRVVFEICMRTDRHTDTRTVQTLQSIQQGLPLPIVRNARDFFDLPRDGWRFCDDDDVTLSNDVTESRRGSPDVTVLIRKQSTRHLGSNVAVVIYTVSQKNVLTLKRYSSKL